MGDGGKTFGAALEQFEQLLGAARNAPPASAPLLLFYALTQAGRAILAAHAPEAWEVHGHGLSIRTERNRIGDTAATPAGDGLFQAVAAATGSGTLTGKTTLAQIWGSIPRLHREAGLGLEAAPIFMVGQEPPGGLRRVIRDEHGTLLRAAEPFTARANGYPAITAAEVTLNQQGEFVVVGLDFEEPAAAEAFDASLWTYLEQAYLRVAPGGDDLSGLMTWWGLLQALSQLARYEPAGWTAALTPDKSPLAVPIEQTLQHATPAALGVGGACGARRKGGHLALSRDWVRVAEGLSQLPRFETASRVSLAHERNTLACRAPRNRRL